MANRADIFMEAFPEGREGGRGAGDSLRRLRGGLSAHLLRRLPGEPPGCHGQAERFRGEAA